MNPEIKKKWVEALRSGKYEQGIRVLRSKKDEYCCLGVLCDLTYPEDWNGAFWKDTPAPYYRMHSEGGQLPTEIMNEVGLNVNNCKTLVHLNDEGHSFNEIADYIETNL